MSLSQIRKAPLLSSLFVAAGLLITQDVEAGLRLPSVKIPSVKIKVPSVKQIAKNVGREVNKGSRNIRRATHKALKDADRTAHKALGDTQRTVQKAVSDTDRTIRKAAKDTEVAVHKGIGDAGDAIEKGAHDIGKAAEKGGKWVGDHPWETAIAVAAIAGGYYLVVQEGYSFGLTVQGTQVLTVNSAASGVAVGSGGVVVGGTVAGGTVMAAGVGVAANAALQPNEEEPFEQTDSDSIYEPTSDSADSSVDTFKSNTNYNLGDYQFEPSPTEQPKYKLGEFEYTPDPALMGIDKFGSNNVLAEAAGESPFHHEFSSDPNHSPGAQSYYLVAENGPSSIMYAPFLPRNPNEMDRINYADRVAEWAKSNYPIQNFDPAKYPELTPAETKLIDALTSLGQIKDTAYDVAAREQAEENIVAKLSKDWATGEAVEYGIKKAFGAATATAYTIIDNALSILEPTVVTEGWPFERDKKIKVIWTQLEQYMDKRREAAGHKPRMPFSEPLLPNISQPPTSPVFEPNYGPN